MNYNLEQLAAKLQQQMQQMGKASYFGASRKGENAELRTGLNSQYPHERKDSIKRVIANMTVGKDVSGLFPDVLKNMQTEDLEQKKLVYLYLINYAKTQPELVILAVNTFIKDTDDSNPLIRALAIRTMGVLRAEKIMDYVSDPLRKTLRDDNPYVRKTAVLAVAKLYGMNPVLCVDNGFVATLQDMLGDSNPMVVANTVTALAEIEDFAAESGRGGSADDGDDAAENGGADSDPSTSPAIFQLDAALISKLLVALGECTEWGRIAILTAIAKYRTSDEKEAEQICERVVPQFQHANGSVVLSAIKVILIHLRAVHRDEFIRSIMRKMAPPLVTLVSSAPEVQWVALRNINLILQQRPDVLSNEMRVFFCKYNDPGYVKLEKLEIMVKLCTEKNIDTLLSELKEYASEVDYDFVKRAVRAIGQCAIKIDAAAEKCVNVLLELIATRVSYVVQEAIIVIKDIFRKYPSRYEGIIPTLCANLEDLDEPEAKASLIWILGEYADKIDNADEILSTFLDNFSDESAPVQLQTLTAIVKLYLKRPESAQALVQGVLQNATKNCENPDIRDRAYVYWRLLSTDPEAAKAVVLAPRPSISLPLSTISPALLAELTSELSTLASVYHKPVQAFIGRGRLTADEVARGGGGSGSGTRRNLALDAADDLTNAESATATRAIAVVAQGQRSENLLDFGDDDATAATSAGTAGSAAPAFGGLGGLDFSGGGGGGGASGAAPLPAAGARSGALPGKAAQNPLDDLMGLFDSAGLGAGSTSSGTTAGGGGGLNGLGGFGQAQPQSQPQQSQKKSDLDLMGDLF